MSSSLKSLHFSVLFQAYADLRLHHHQPGSTGKWEFKDFLQPKKTGKRYWEKSLIFGVQPTHPCDSSTAAPHELPPSVKSSCYAGAHPTCQNVHKTPAEAEVWRSPWIPAGWWFARGCYRAACSSLATEHPTHKYRHGGGWSDTSLGSRRGEHLSAFWLNTEELELFWCSRCVVRPAFLVRGSTYWMATALLLVKSALRL